MTVYGPPGGGGGATSWLPEGVATGQLYGVWATALQFTTYNPTLPIGYIGFEYDTMRFKIADGIQDWNSLPYYHDVIPYSSGYGNEIGWTQASAAQDTWYPISYADIENGPSLYITQDGSGKFTVQETGKYLLNYGMSAEASIVGKHVQSAVLVNGSSTGQAIQHHEALGADTQFNLSATAILDLSKGDTVEIGIRTTDTGTPDLTVDHLTISLVWVGV